MGLSTFDSSRVSSDSLDSVVGLGGGGVLLRPVVVVVLVGGASVVVCPVGVVGVMRALMRLLQGGEVLWLHSGCGLTALRCGLLLGEVLHCPVGLAEVLLEEAVEVEDGTRQHHDTPPRVDAQGAVEEGVEDGGGTGHCGKGEETCRERLLTGEVPVQSGLRAVGQFVVPQPVHALQLVYSHQLEQSDLLAFDLGRQA